jgi:hypothetical protein
LVDEAGKTMEEIVTSVKHVADIMSEITAASQEQSSGIEQVNHAIAQMDEMTQQNAALVEQAAAAAESMRTQASTLAQAVAVFKLNNADQQAMLATPHTRSPDTQRKPLPARSASKAMTTKPAQSPYAKKSALPAGTGDEWEEF